jgi:ring-1,2-phenylacetyl-CoA epoxidase subunit PaaE
MQTEVVLTDPPDDPALFKSLRQRPRVAWPTVALLFVAYGIFGLSTYAFIHGNLSLVWAIVFNSLAAYISFTPTHEASHHSVSSNHQLNEWVGRVATALQSPVPFFRAFRYLHMQHHRFTNDKTKDPDVYVGTGPWWLLPFKWLSLDLSYLYFYSRPSVFLKRPKGERLDLLGAFVFGAGVITAVTWAGWFEYYVLLFVVPGRITALFLAIAFDFLPHFPHEAQGQDQRFQSTSNRAGMEWLMTPLLIFQNYHLVHHLYPTVPFYRYLKIWKSRRRFHLSQNPSTTTTFGLRPMVAATGLHDIENSR